MIHRLYKLFPCVLCSGFVLSGIKVIAQQHSSDSTNSNSKSVNQSPNASSSAGPTGSPQPTPADTSSKKTFKPKGNLWGYAFGDFYYKAHADALNRGGSNQYTGIAQSRNGFQLRRVYLGYDYDISKRFSAELLLAAEDNETTSPYGMTPSMTTGDLLGDNKISFYIKLINLRWNNVWKGTDLIIGQQVTPAFPLLSEKMWGYRSIERTVADIRRTPPIDLGVGLQGRFDPGTDNFGYDLLVANGTSAKPANSSFKWFYGDIYAKFFSKKLILDLYTDYQGLAPRSATNPSEARSMIKAYIAYTTPKVTIGLEAFTNRIRNGVQAADTAKKVQFADVKAVAISAYVRGTITKNKLGYFARYDNYNPGTNFNTNFTYSKPVVSQYDPNTREMFITAGLDITPEKNIHIMPTIWYNQYTSHIASFAGTSKSDHDLVYRLTALFVFGK